MLRIKSLICDLIAMDEPHVSVILPSYNVEETLERTLEGVLKQDYEHMAEILIIDAGSSDHTPDIAKEYASEHEKIELVSKDLDGLAATINEGIRQSSSEIVCTINPDCVPASEDWLRELVSALDPEEDIVGAQPVQEIPEDLVESSSLPYKMFCGTRDSRDLEEAEIGPYNFQPNGCVFVKSAIEELGLLDEENYSRAGEDYDISIKAQEKGYRSAFVPMVLLHYHGLGSSFGMKDYLAKQLQYSEAQGAITRRYPFKRHYTFWNEFTKSGLYASVFVPWLNLATIPLLTLYLTIYTYQSREVLSGTELLRAPFIKLLGDIYNIIGFYKGLITGRQTSTSHHILEFSSN